MKRLILKRPELPILAALAAVLLVGYQNCANKMSFDGSEAAGKLVSGADTGTNTPLGDNVGGNNPPNTGDGSTPGTTPGTTPGSTPGTTPGTTPPVTNMPPGTTTPGGTNPPPNTTMPTPTTPIAILPTPGNENDDDTTIDIDHTGKKVVFACSTGAASKMLSESDLQKAENLSLSNAKADMFFYANPLKYVSLSNLHGSIGILNAWKILNASNIGEGQSNKDGDVVYLRAYAIDSASNIHGRIATELTTMRIGNVSNVHGGSICASANSFDSFSNLHGAFVKIRGRDDSTGASAEAQSISNIHAIFTSLYKLNVGSLSNINSDGPSDGGEIIIRDSVIDDLSNVQGGVTLINTKIKRLSNFKGVLRKLNSTIDSESNADYKVEPVLATK